MIWGQALGPYNLDEIPFDLSLFFIPYKKGRLKSKVISSNFYGPGTRD